jgi:hypothetical protein
LFRVVGACVLTLFGGRECGAVVSCIGMHTSACRHDFVLVVLPLWWGHVDFQAGCFETAEVTGLLADCVVRPHTHGGSACWLAAVCLGQQLRWCVSEVAKQEWLLSVLVCPEPRSKLYPWLPCRAAACAARPHIGRTVLLHAALPVRAGALLTTPFCAWHLV